jgi:hypothetical protein
MFRQREEALRDHFARLTAVLDGHGFTGDSGTQGRRGYTGDFLFAWLGATTPLPVHVWSVMAQLGSRLHFYEMPNDDVTDEELDDVLRGTPYRDKMRACCPSIRLFLKARLSEYHGVRGVPWDRKHDPEAVLEHIKRSARLLARCRSLASPDEGAGDIPGDQPPDSEQPFRAVTTLYNLARGRALVYGRRQLTTDDLPLVTRLALSSMPHERAKLVRALIANQGTLRTRDAARVLGVSLPTARRKMEEIARLGIAALNHCTQDARLILRPEWHWCLDLGADSGPHTVPSGFQG